MAGVPSIMQAMVDEVAPKLKTGAKMLSETVRADARKATSAPSCGEIAKAHPDTIIGSYPFFDEKRGPNTNIVVRSRDAEKLAAAKARGGGDAGGTARSRDEIAVDARNARDDRSDPMCRRRRSEIRAAQPAAPGKNLSGLLGPVPPRLRARWPGGCTRPGRSRPSSPSPAAGWCRRRSWRANSTCALIDTVCVASYHDYQNQGELKVLKGVAPEIVTLGGARRARAC